MRTLTGKVVSVKFASWVLPTSSTMTPNKGFLGTDVFSYRALDSSGNQIAGPTNVTVNVVEAARRPGDANADGRGTFDDFVILAGNFGRMDAVLDDGDFDSDGIVSFADCLILSANCEA